MSKIRKLLSPRPLVYRQNIRATETELKQWIYFATIKGKHSTLKLVIQRVKHEIICSHGLCTNWAHIKRFGPLIDSRDIQLSLIKVKYLKSIILERESLSMRFNFPPFDYLPQSICQKLGYKYVKLHRQQVYIVKSIYVCRSGTEIYEL